ncbi:MAG: 4'-phosphopantetheinyl transferase superfamily protein [Clostridia bacterium]|nr:4'-phosphopantetheinyl transferase superfamily protein [Clostridia bacterium]
MNTERAVKIYLFDTEGKEYNSDLLVLIDNYRREKINSSSNVGYKRRSLFAGLLLRHALSQAGVGENSLSDIVRNEYGKPYLKAGKPYFSISHSGNLIAVAVADFNIGIDIEVPQNTDYSRIASKVLSDNEMIDYMKSSDRSVFFTEKWVMKESYLKFIGTGLGKYPKDVTKESITSGGCRFITEKKRENGTEFFISVVSDGPFRVETVSVTDLKVPYIRH